MYVAEGRRGQKVAEKTQTYFLNTEVRWSICVDLKAYKWQNQTVHFRRSPVG